MAFSWYIERQGKQFGPYTGTKLKGLAASGRLQRTDLVRRDDQPTWMAAAKIKGLFAVGDTASPPPLSTANVVGTSSVGTDTSPAPKKPPESAGHSSPTDDSATEPPATRFTRIDSHLRGMVETTKAAARLAAAHARKAHLAKVTLPAAYLELGRDIFATGRFREEFLDLFSCITASQEERQRLGQVRVDGERQRSLFEKATDASLRVKVTAQVKMLALKEDSLLRQLGESSYERHGKASGPENLVRPVSVSRSSLEGLEREIDHLCKIGNGRIVTPRRVLAGGLGFCVVTVALMASKPGAKEGSERKAFGSRPTIQVDEPKQSPKVEVVPSGGRAEVAQKNDRSEVVRSDGQALERPRATIKHAPYTLVVMPPISPTRVHRVPNGSESSPLVEAKGVMNLLGHEGSIGAVAINGAGTIAASGDESGVVKLWDLRARKETASFKGVTR